jgi:SSS family solute:Na+ symporter
VQAYISPPIAAVFLLGICWKRLNAAGAMASLGTGFVLGMGRLVLELDKENLSGFLHTWATINFLNFAALLFLICAAVLVVVSLVTPPPPPEKVRGLTLATADDPLGPQQDGGEAGPRGDSDPAWRRRDRTLSIVVVVLVLIVMLYFSNLFFG